MTSKKFLIAMNKVTNMQVNTVKLLHRAGSVLLCAMALLALGSCRDDLQEPKGNTSEQTSQSSIDNYIGKVNISLEATLEPMPDQSGRSLNYQLMDRGERIGIDGGTVPAGADYTGEVGLRMALTEGSTVSGCLIFYHDNGTVVRDLVDFKVIEGVKKADGTFDPRAKNRIKYVGDISFPTGVTLQDEFAKEANNAVSVYTQRIPAKNTTKNSGWHVMAMIGYQDMTTTYTTTDGPEGSDANRFLVGTSQDSRYRITSSDTYDHNFRSTASVTLSTPCASAWMPLYITHCPGENIVTGVNYDFRLKPQGVILQYDLAAMGMDTQDVRRHGLISNVLDFGGYYDLSEASIKKAFDGKGTDDYGLPTWVPNKSGMEDLSMNYAPKSDAPLSSGDRIFPWDMPTLSSTRSALLKNWADAGNNPWTIEKASVISITPLGNSADEVTERSSGSYPWLQATKLWTFYTLGGGYFPRTVNGSRVILHFWGMPRTADRMPEESKRATYLFASSHSLLTDDDAWDAGKMDNFDTQVYINIIRTANQKSNDLVDRKNKIAEAKTDKDKQEAQADYDAYKTYYETDAASNPYSNVFPGAIFPAAKKAMELAKEYAYEANKGSVTPRTQPLMVLHQTNRMFTEGKVYHAQAVIHPDLMLSEVIYQKHDGENYSLLEVYNTTVEPVDLSQYAVVRLIPSTDGSHLAFRNKEGQPVESLEHALVLPLTALKGKNDPFDGSALTSLKQAGYNYDDPTKRAKPVFYRPAWTITLEGGLWSGKWAYNHLEYESTTYPTRSFYLLKGQSILLGGSGYVNTPVTKGIADYPDPVELVEPEGWFKTLYGLLQTNYDRHYLRYAYAYADGVKTNNTFGEGTLDYKPGDAFALIKKTSTGWQIIDATGPVGPKHLAFAGTYDSFKTEMAKHSKAERFSLQRLDGVNYPFIAPFRTNRLYPAKWSDDWNIQTDVNQFTPGRRFGYSGWELSFGSWEYQIKRTPIDTKFTTYQDARPTRGF